MAEPAKVFLSHAQEDETEVEHLYDQLSQDGMKPWMSKRDIIAGEDWERSILRAMRAADFLLVCLSLRAVAKRGFLQKEIKQALRMWEEKLEDDIYLIPVRLEDCRVPDALARFQWVDLFRDDGYERLIKGIRAGAERLERRMTAAADMGIVTKEILERDPDGLAYEISVQYPQIEPADEDSSREANARVHKFVTEIAERFRNESLAAVASEGQRKFRLEHKMWDSLDVRFSVSIFTGKILSIRFTLWTYGAGAAHPNSRTSTFNFLLAPFEQLHFADLFFAESNYVKTISEYCIRDLHQQVARERGLDESEYRNDNWIIQGAGPTYSNFGACVLAKTGLLVVFDPYQVGSYAEGTREVLIPPEVLRGLLRKEILAALEGAW